MNQKMRRETEKFQAMVNYLRRLMTNWSKQTIWKKKIFFYIFDPSRQELWMKELELLGGFRGRKQFALKLMIQYFIRRIKIFNSFSIKFNLFWRSFFTSSTKSFHHFYAPSSPTHFSWRWKIKFNRIYRVEPLDLLFFSSWVLKVLVLGITIN